MFCPQCGKEFTVRVNFCSQCGTALFTPRAPRKPLVRSRTDRKIAGVCAGFADYLDIDPSLVRILWVALVVFGGCGLLAYLIAWIIMPEERLPQSSLAPAPGASAQPAPGR
jgi:phage shock protein C